MPKIITVPGVDEEFEFPDTMDDNAIREVMRKKFAKPAVSAAATPPPPPPTPLSSEDRPLDDKAEGIWGGIKEWASGVPSAVGTILQYSPAGDIASGRAPGMGAVELAKNVATAAKDKFKKHGQAAWDQLEFARLANEEAIAKGGRGEWRPELNEALAQSLLTVVPELETEEVIPGSGGAIVPTKKALGKLIPDVVLSTLGTRLSPTPLVTKPASSLLSKVPSPPAAIRAAFGLAEDAKAVAAAKKGSPLPKLDFKNVPGGVGPAQPMTIAKEGKVIGEAENLAFRVKKDYFNKIYRQMDEWGTIDARAIIDEAGNLRIPSDVALPEHMASAVKTIQAELKRLPKGGGEVATSPKLEAAFRQLQETPFSVAHELRHELGVAGRRVDPRGMDPSKAVPYWQAQDGVDNLMQQAADLVPGAKQLYDETTRLYKADVALPHYRGAGRDISKLMEGDAPTPEMMGEVIPAFGADTVESAYRALVPDASRYGAAAAQSGQKAFDQLVDQTIKTKLGAKNVGDTIDLTTAAEALRTKVGDAGFQAMLQRASPEMQQYMQNLKRAAEAYEKIGAATPLDKAAYATGLQGGSVGATFRFITRMKPTVLKWALAHPARTEVLINGMNGTVDASQLGEYATRNVSNIIRLYNMDTMRPPAPEKSGLKAVNQ